MQRPGSAQTACIARAAVRSSCITCKHCTRMSESPEGQWSCSRMPVRSWQFPVNVTGWACSTLVTSTLLQAVGVGTSATAAAASISAGVGAAGRLVSTRWYLYDPHPPKTHALPVPRSLPYVPPGSCSSRSPVPVTPVPRRPSHFPTAVSRFSLEPSAIK